MVVNITIRAVSILQTETGLVSLCNPGAIQSQQVVMCEHLNAVVVPEKTEGENPGESVCVCMCVYVCFRKYMHLH